MVSSETNGILLKQRSLKSRLRVCLPKIPLAKQGIDPQQQTSQPRYKQKLNGGTARKKKKKDLDFLVLNRMLGSGVSSTPE